MRQRTSFTLVVIDKSWRVCRIAIQWRRSRRKGKTMAKTNPAAMTDAEQVCCWTNRIAREMSSATSRAVAAHDLSAMEANILIRIDFGLNSPTKIANCLGIDVSNVSRLIRTLEKKELATREVDDENRSRAILRLTKKGRQKVAEARPDKRQMEETIMSALSDNERKSLLRIARKLSEALQAFDPSDG